MECRFYFISSCISHVFTPDCWKLKLSVFWMFPNGINFVANFVKIYHCFKSRRERHTNSMTINLPSGPLSPEVMQQGRESDHSHPSRADVKNCGAVSPFPPCLDGIVFNYVIKYGDKCNLTWTEWTKSAAIWIFLATAVSHLGDSPSRNVRISCRLRTLYSTQFSLSHSTAIRFCFCTIYRRASSLASQRL